MVFLKEKSTGAATLTGHDHGIIFSLPQLSLGAVGSYSRGRWVGLRDQVRRRKREADIAGCQGMWLWREECGHQGSYNGAGEQRPSGMTLQRQMQEEASTLGCCLTCVQVKMVGVF